MISKVLVEEHQANCGDDRARNSQPGNRPAASEHANEEQGANPDNEEGPESSPEVKSLEDLSNQSQCAEDDQQAAAD